VSLRDASDRRRSRGERGSIPVSKSWPAICVKVEVRVYICCPSWISWGWVGRGSPLSQG
jgi:hypothetical protein